MADEEMTLARKNLACSGTSCSQGHAQSQAPSVTACELNARPTRDVLHVRPNGLHYVLRSAVRGLRSTVLEQLDSHRRGQGDRVVDRHAYSPQRYRGEAIEPRIADARARR